MCKTLNDWAVRKPEEVTRRYRNINLVPHSCQSEEVAECVHSFFPTLN